MMRASMGRVVLAVLAGVSISTHAGGQENRLVVRADQPSATISKHLYGHFSEHLGHCVYGGIWVGESSSIPNTRGIRNDVVKALKEIGTPNMRWPGGCFADEYHWSDGIGPREKRPSMINTHWGGVTENNHFGTHEFLDFCEQVGCEPYICGNLGSGEVREMQNWVEYMTSGNVSPMTELRKLNGREKPWAVRYFGVGNENWGCGGNMTAEFYADQYKRYATYLRNFGGNRLYKVACGPNGADYHWTETLMSKAGRQMDGLSLHYYCGTGDKSRSATKFEEDDWFALLRRAGRMEELVTKHSAIMDKYDPRKRVGLLVDEWGAWHAVEPGTNPGFLYQQNTMRDALVAAINLNIFNRHSDRVRMANIAQVINVLQSVILTDGEKMLLTPTYHVFAMYKVHHEATALPIELTSVDYTQGGEKIPALSASASKDSEGRVNITIANLDSNNPAELSLAVQGIGAKAVSGRVLTAPTMQAHNTFDMPDTVRPADFPGARIEGNSLRATLPPKSVVLLTIR
ncbi:MAG: alpha-N-arabinofuranosidase [Isosphaeraceae bacterium]